MVLQNHNWLVEGGLQGECVLLTESQVKEMCLTLGAHHGEVSDVP